MERAMYIGMKSRISISSYDIALPFSDSLIEKIIKIKTTVTNDVNVAMSWIKDVEEGATLGLEVQCYNVYDHYFKPAILTLCDVDRCLILQLCRRHDEEGIIKDLLLPVERFVGANLGRSAAMLKEAYGINVPGYEEANKNTYVFWSDVSLWVDQFLGQIPVRVSKLMMVLMMMRKRPEVEGAVWEKEELDMHLVAYATLESYVYYMLLNE